MFVSLSSPKSKPCPSYVSTHGINSLFTVHHHLIYSQSLCSNSYSQRYYSGRQQEPDNIFMLSVTLPRLFSQPLNGQSSGMTGNGSVCSDFDPPPLLQYKTKERGRTHNVQWSLVQIEMLCAFIYNCPTCKDNQPVWWSINK